MTDTLISPIFAQAAEHLQSFIADCDRRTELAKKRLAETQEEISAEVAAKVTEPLFKDKPAQGFSWTATSFPYLKLPTGFQ